MTTRILRALFFLTFLSSVLAAEKVHPLFGPAVTPAVIGLVLFGLSGLVHWIQFFRFGRQPFMLALAIGMIAMAAGFAVRILVSHNPTSLPLNIASTLLILLSPCLFIALDYMILGRLAVLFGPEVSNKTMFIAPTRVATIFIWSDVGTFLVQALGGSMTLNSDPKKSDLGNKIALVGLALQLGSFALFASLMVVFGFRVKQRFPNVWRAQGYGSFTAFGGEQVANWRILYYTLCFSCVAILIRSIFRMAEFIQGHAGYLSTHEVYFYVLDSLPLWIAMTLYCAVWPPRFLAPPAKADAMELKGTGAIAYPGAEASYA
ncbi:RTA1 like protein-domain-containing protein [Mycena vulgaris]|nr:RTA1 like protein-domain-containing protein [Mycena vulgaris]